MSTNTPPFEVICIDNSDHAIDDNNNIIKSPKPVIGNTYTVIDEVKWRDILFYVIKELPEDFVYDADFFRRIPPYQNSVSKELAEKAMETVKDNQDIKPVRKEVEA